MERHSDILACKTPNFSRWYEVRGPVGLSGWLTVLLIIASVNASREGETARARAKADDDIVSLDCRVIFGVREGVVLITYTGVKVKLAK